MLAFIIGLIVGGNLGIIFIALLMAHEDDYKK